MVVAACGDPIEPLATADHGVIFTFPIDGQLDVPLGSRVVVTFSDRVNASALGPCTGTGDSVSGALCLVGPDGAVDAAPEVSSDGYSVAFDVPTLEPGTTYAVYARQALSASARNLPASGPLFSFTTRSSRLRAASPSLIAVNGGTPDAPAAFRPLFETSTIRLVFSEPLDARTVVAGANAIELVDMQTSSPVPATVIASGIHVAIDPTQDLRAGATYQLRLGGQLLDLTGQPLAPTTVVLTPENSLGTGMIPQVLRTRLAGDPGPERSRSGTTPNAIVIDKPLIGRETADFLASTVRAELGDPKAFGGPIAFRIPRGQRLHAKGLDLKLGGQIPAGLSTGDIEIELLTDAGGRLYRNRYQPASQVPENARSPLYVDLYLDVAVYAKDVTGNAVVAQTVLGVQATGTALATDGVLAIETVASLDFALLGIATAPSNLVLELITDPSASISADTQAPSLVSTSPPAATSEHSPDAGITLVFDEPVDLDRLRAGGVKMTNTANTMIATAVESHGSAVVVRPLAPLANGALYTVALDDVADLAGNKLAPTTFGFTTPPLASTGVPPALVAAYPGAPCALDNGHCAGGADSDDAYAPFTLPANEAIDLAFTSPLRRNTVALGFACNQGTVRVEEVDAGGACIAAVPGSLLVRERGLGFVPDRPWEDGKSYKLTLVSGGNDTCDAGELCGTNNVPVSFDPLAGAGDGEGGGPSLVIPFTGGPANPGLFVRATAAPFSDINGSGTDDGGEMERDENRAALRIAGSTGDVSDPELNGPDCVLSTPETENCMYLQGVMPVSLGELENDCALPDGTRAPVCVPLEVAPLAMYATTISMDTTILGLATVTADTGISVMRLRQPSAGPVRGFIIDKAGVPTLISALELYMDAPDMSLPLGADHDLHSKAVTMVLEGPLTFLPDGRLVISLSNTADVPITVNIDAPLGIGGSVELVLPRGEMRLQLASPFVRGGAP